MNSLFSKCYKSKNAIFQEREKKVAGLITFFHNSWWKIRSFWGFLMWSWETNRTIVCSVKFHVCKCANLKFPKMWHNTLKKDSSFSPLPRISITLLWDCHAIVSLSIERLGYGRYGQTKGTNAVFRYLKHIPNGNDSYFSFAFLFSFKPK